MGMIKYIEREITPPNPPGTGLCQPIIVWLCISKVLYSCNDAITEWADYFTCSKHRVRRGDKKGVGRGVGVLVWDLYTNTSS